MLRTFMTSLLCLSLSGCVERSLDLTRVEREQLSQYIDEAPTNPEHPLSINFENRVELIGYDLSSDQWRPGQELVVTWHWRVTRALEDDWRLFTHISNGPQPRVLNEDGAGTVRDLYQPGRWKTGEYIRDEQRITLPADWSTGQAIFYLGIWRGDARLRIVDGPADDDNRARAAVVPVQRGGRVERPQAPETPTLETKRAVEITLDGVLDEPEWNEAQSTRAFVNTMTGGTAPFRVTARTLYDDENLYVAFLVADTFLKSEFENHDDHLWEQDCVEVFVDPDGDGRNYFEMQVSPNGVSFDTRYDSRRQPQPIGDDGWDSGLRAGVRLDGTVNDDERDEGYTVEIAIPWTAFAHGPTPAEPPSAGDEWRVNFYAMDMQPNGQRAAAWSPPMVGDFHMPARFGTLRFATAPDSETPVEAEETGNESDETAQVGSVRPELREVLRQRLETPQGERSQSAPTE